jgi:hypothetical protein
LEVWVFFKHLEHAKSIHALILQIKLDIKEYDIGAQFTRHLDTHISARGTKQLNLFVLKPDLKQPVNQHRVVDRKNFWEG